MHSTTCVQWRVSSGGPQKFDKYDVISCSSCKKIPWKYSHLYTYMYMYTCTCSGMYVSIVHVTCIYNVHATCSFQKSFPVGACPQTTPMCLHSITCPLHQIIADGLSNPHLQSSNLALYQLSYRDSSAGWAESKANIGKAMQQAWLIGEHVSTCIYIHVTCFNFNIDFYFSPVH